MTLTNRVVVRLLAVMGLVLGGVVLLTYELVLISGRSEIDELLRSEAASLGRALDDELHQAAGRDGQVSTPEAERAARRALSISPSGTRHVALVSVDGRRLQSTGGPPRVAALMRGADAPATVPGSIRTVETAAGPVRVLDTAVRDRSDNEILTVTVVAPLDQVHDTAGTVLRRAAVASAVGVAVGGGLLWLVARRTLRPVHDVSAAASAISPADLTTRVPVPGTHDEIATLAAEINRMLDRIEEADTTRRRYLAAISHEVRTPLAVAEGHLELLDQPEAAIVRGELHRLRRVLDDMMAVARGHDEVDVRDDPIYLPDLFASVRERVRALPYAPAVTVSEPPHDVLIGDQARIEQCLANLIDNAVDHNPAGTSVTLAALTSATEVILAVADDGPGIAASVESRVFEPFVTTRTTGSARTSGLGLPVVQALVEAQGGRVDLTSTPEGTTVTLVLRRATAKLDGG